MDRDENQGRPVGAFTRCAYGYPQEPGRRCGLCGRNTSNGEPCPKATPQQEERTP